MNGKKDSWAEAGRVRPHNGSCYSWNTIVLHDQTNDAQVILMYSQDSEPEKLFKNHAEDF